MADKEAEAQLSLVLAVPHQVMHVNVIMVSRRHVQH